MKPNHDGLIEGLPRDFELGAALAALPQPELPEDMDARLRAAIERARHRKRRRVVVLSVAAAVATLLTLGGVALAGGFGSHRPPEEKPFMPANLPAAGGSQSLFTYPINAHGQTYGPNREGVQEPDLVAVSATHGENGYCWWTDLDGPLPATPQEALWIQNAGRGKQREVPVYKSDGVTRVGDFVVGGVPWSEVTAAGTAIEHPASTEIAAQAPAWLLGDMVTLARKAGDANAWAWWTLTTAGKAVVVEGKDAPSTVSDPNRPVYVVIELGDFTNWLWSQPASGSAPTYSWIYELIDAGSRTVDSAGASARPFSDTGLDVNIVGLRAAGGG